MKLILPVILLHISVTLFAQNSKGVEIVYGHKDGLAMSMIMLKPTARDNGKAIISIVSGNWRSGYNGALRSETRSSQYLDAGYTVFLVMHGSQPRYNIVDAVSDIKRSVRYIRYNAATLKIDPAHIGITGASSGGHLALLVATTAKDADSATIDPVNKVSDRVQAVAVFYPPTDFINFGATGFGPVNSEKLLKDFGVIAAFDFRKWNEKSQVYEYASPEERIKISREISPIYNVTADDAPALLIHGDADKVVPLQQSQIMIAAYQNAKVISNLVIKPGGGHGWPNAEVEEKQFIEWFDKYLK